MRLSLRSQGLRRVVLLLAAVCLVLGAATVALVQRASATTTTLVTFAKPGSYVWAVPKGVTTATFTVYGASGGWVLQRNANHTITTISKGGLGGEAKATFTVHAGEKFEVVVGGEGGVAYYLDPAEAVALGGFNGGGVGSFVPNYPTSSGGGGGASDVRIGGRGDNCVPTRSCSFGGRIVVGGGGGGGSQFGNNGDNGGGLRGTPNACDGLAGGESGAQDCAGLSPSECPTVGTTVRGVAGFGFGAAGCMLGAGGGGGGWWGGNSSIGKYADGSSGGGGSGYISPFAKNGSFPGGTQKGDGKVIVTTTT